MLRSGVGTMTGQGDTPPGGDLAQGMLCPLSEEAISLLPYSFLELDAEGTVLRVDIRGAKPDCPAQDRIVGRLLFSDLIRPPDSTRVARRYRAMVRRESDNRCLAAIPFNLHGQDRCVQLVLSYYASAGRGYVILREAP